MYSNILFYYHYIFIIHFYIYCIQTHKCFNSASRKKPRERGVKNTKSTCDEREPESISII
jgi:hypothetical protein